MKIFTAIVFSCVWASALVAQPTITRATFFSPGDKLFTTETTTVPDPGASGANRTWDFSALVVDPDAIEVTIAQSDTTPFFGTFPTSNIAEVFSFGSTGYQYDLITNNSYEIQGLVVSGIYQITYSDPWMVLQFPITYNTQWQDTYANTLDYFISPVSIQGEGTVNNLVDGYGTLMLPHATFTDALRLKMIEESSDTSDLGQGLSEKNVNHDTTYVWLSPSYPGPLCILSRSVQEHYVYLVSTNPDTVIVDVETLKSSSFSLDPMSGTSAVRDEVKPGKYAMEIAPNPFEQSIEIRFTSDQPKAMQLNVQDLNGRIVYRQDITAQAGENSVQLSMPDFASGVYVAMLHSADGADVQKLIRIEGRH